jgi:DNA-binding CsgD family transcriptional regulator
VAQPRKILCIEDDRETADFRPLGLHHRSAPASRAPSCYPNSVKLKDRAIEVFTWVARSKTSAGIARMRRLSKRTVDFHIDNSRIKLGASTRTGAATN